MPGAFTNISIYSKSFSVIDSTLSRKLFIIKRIIKDTVSAMVPGNQLPDLTTPRTIYSADRYLARETKTLIN